jgi:hypothetical protein
MDLTTKVVFSTLYDFLKTPLNAYCLSSARKSPHVNTTHRIGIHECGKVFDGKPAHNVYTERVLRTTTGTKTTSGMASASTVLTIIAATINLHSHAANIA